MSTLCDAAPNACRDELLRTEANVALLRSLHHLIDVASKVLPNEGRAAANALAGFLPEEKATGFLRVYNACLTRAIRAKNVELARGYLKEFSTLRPAAAAPRPTILSLDRKHPAPHHLRFIDVVNDSIYETYRMRNDFGPLASAHPSFAAAHTALNRLAAVDKQLADELEVLLSEIFLFESTTFNAGTSLHALGIVWMSHLKDGHSWARYYEHLVHEAAHHHLYYVLQNDPLYLNDPNELYASPFRSEMRPIGGIYHGMFVLARTLRAVHALERSADYDAELDVVSTIHNNAKNPASFEEKFEDCIVVLQKHANLTDIGRGLMESAREMAYA